MFGVPEIVFSKVFETSAFDITAETSSVTSGTVVKQAAVTDTKE